MQAVFRSGCSRVSEPDSQFQSAGSLYNLPAFKVSAASTTVEMNEGQNLVIGGLLKDKLTETIEAVPLLGQLPLLGALFRHTSMDSERSRSSSLFARHWSKQAIPCRSFRQTGLFRLVQIGFFSKENFKARNNMNRMHANTAAMRHAQAPKHAQFQKGAVMVEFAFILPIFCFSFSGWLLFR